MYTYSSNKGGTGTVKRTKSGELSINIDQWEMLTKSLLPLPDKHKGLVDIGKRYRHRHLDLIVNKQVKYFDIFGDC